jgi:hypothetical protein
MRFSLPCMALMALSAATSSASAADLSKVDRTLMKEPAYVSKSPGYGLVVVGPEAKTRIWLVLDGDLLHVDRNGNGDLTDAGEKIEPRPVLLTGLRRPGDPEPKAQSFDTKALNDVEIRVLTINDNYVQVDVKDTARKIEFCAIHDKFAVKPKDAPIIFCGPLTFIVPGKLTLQRGDKPGNLTVHVGRPAQGACTSVSIRINDVPKDSHPVAEISFPHKDKPGEVIKVRAVLDQRC